MSTDEFTKLFKQLEDVKARLADVSTKDDIATLRDEMHVGFDQTAARLDDDYVERAALTAQTDRHEGWIKQLADKTGTDLVIEA
jgi:hypothetical protein